MDTADITNKRIPEKVTLEFAKRLVEIVNDDPDDFNSYYNDSAQKTLAVRENVRGMNAPITNNATIIPTGFSSGIVGNSTSLVSK